MSYYNPTEFNIFTLTEFNNALNELSTRKPFTCT